LATYKRNLVFAAACIGLMLFGIMLITLGAILPSLAIKFQLDEISSGKIVSLLPLGILIGSLVFGPIADIYGYKILLILTTLLAVFSFQAMAFSPSLSLLQISILVIGISGGIINGATNALVSDISSENKSANLSLLGVFFGIGALGMPLLLSILLKYFSYEAILSSVGFAMLLAVVYFLFILFPAPKQAQGFPVKAGIRLLKQPIMLLTGLFLFFQSGTEGLVNNWGTTFLQTGLFISEKESLFILSCYLGGLTVARVLLGRLLKKISSFKVAVGSILLTAAGSYFLNLSSNYNEALISLITIGAGLAAGFPVALSYIGQIYAELSGTAFSMTLVIAMVGSTLLNYICGVVAHLHGIKQLPVLMMITAACMLVLMLLIRKQIASKIKM
jgi:MFS family permease